MYEGYPKAQQPPQVIMGDSLSASTYWHGKELNQWANDWVKLHTNGQGNFVTSNMEDSGTLTALRRLSKTDRVDLDRVLVLRTVSNFSMQPPGKTAGWSTTAPYPAQGRPALDAAYKVGSRVVREIVQNWETYEDTVPGAGKIKDYDPWMGFEMEDTIAQKPEEFSVFNFQTERAKYSLLWERRALADPTVSAKV